MNKKTLFLILFGALLLPALAQAATLMGIIGAITAEVVPIGTPLVAVGFIIAGFLYISAAASPERMALAKKALIAAIIGTILIILADGACTFIATLFGLPADSCKSGANSGGGSGGPGHTLADLKKAGFTEGDAHMAAFWEALQGKDPAQDAKTLVDDAHSFQKLSVAQKTQFAFSLQPLLNTNNISGLSADQAKNLPKLYNLYTNPSLYIDKNDKFIPNPNYNNTLANNVNSNLNSLVNTFNLSGTIND